MPTKPLEILRGTNANRAGCALRAWLIAVVPSLLYFFVLVALGVRIAASTRGGARREVCRLQHSGSTIVGNGTDVSRGIRAWTGDPSAPPGPDRALGHNLCARSQIWWQLATGVCHLLAIPHLFRDADHLAETLASKRVRAYRTRACALQWDVLRRGRAWFHAGMPRRINQRNLDVTGHDRSLSAISDARSLVCGTPTAALMRQVGRPLVAVPSLSRPISRLVKPVGWQGRNG